MPGEELTAWLDEYSLCHQNPINIVLHKICIPIITASLFGMLWSLPLVPQSVRHTISVGNVGLFNPSLILVPILAFYWNLSAAMTLGMTIFFLGLIALVILLEKNHVRIFRLSVIVFILGWIGQFIGHEIEGKKPAFFKDLQFLLIGPLWTLASAFRWLGIEF